MASNEKQVRELLEQIWNQPKESENLIAKCVEKNKTVYEFEEFLEQSSPKNQNSQFEEASA